MFLCAYSSKWRCRALEMGFKGLLERHGILLADAMLVLI